MAKLRSYFFTGLDGPTYHLFRTENKPDRTAFEDLFDSILFKLEPSDTATETQNGHARRASHAHQHNRAYTLAEDGITRFAIPEYLSDVHSYAQIAVGGASVLGVASTSRGITVTPAQFTPTGASFYRKNFVIESDVTLASAGGTVTVTEAPALSKHFNVEVNYAHANAYKLKPDAGGTAEYLDSLIETDHFQISAGDLLELKYQNTTSIAISDNASGIMCDIILDGASLSVGAAGLSLTNAANYLTTTSSLSLTGLVQFAQHPRFIAPYAAPTNLLEYTPKQYVDGLDALATHLAGVETITGTKTFTVNPRQAVYIAPVLATEYTTKQYVDTEIAAITDVFWSAGAGTDAIIRTGMTGTAIGNYASNFGYAGTADGNYAVAMGRNCQSDGDYSVTGGFGCIANGDYNAFFGRAVVGAAGTDYAAGFGYNNAFTTAASQLAPFMWGQDNEQQQGHSAIGGRYGIGWIPNSVTFSGGQHSLAGDMMFSDTMLKIDTTDATANVEMVNETAGFAGVAIPTDCIVAVTIHVIAVQTGGGAGTVGDNFSQTITCTVENDGGTVALVANGAATQANVQTVAANVTYILPCNTAAFAGTVQVVADNVAKTLDVEVTGEVNKNISWQAHVHMDIIGFRNYAP